VQISLLGRHQVYAALAAVTVGLVPGRAAGRGAAGAGRRPAPAGATEPVAGIHETVILDDSFSASLASTAAALDTLALFKGGRRCAVLSDLPDLGSMEGEAYRRVGEQQRGSPISWSLRAMEPSRSPSTPRPTGCRPARSWPPTQPKTPCAAWQAASSRATRSWSRDRSSHAWSRSRRPAGEPERAAELLAPRGQTAGWQEGQAAPSGRPTWVEVTLEAIAHNVQRIVEMVGPEVIVMAVLKADGYGHERSEWHGRR